MKKFNIVILIVIMITLSGCNMVAWDSGFEDEYQENEDGTLTTKDGKILNSRGEVIGTVDDNPTDDNDDNNNPTDDVVVDDTSDPYRKYDDGVIEYNYSEIEWVQNGVSIYYTKKDSQVLHGMYITTNDGNPENGITAIGYYYDGEEVRYVEYYDYPLIESDRRYLEVTTDEYYFYYFESEQVLEYIKSELVDNVWKYVERIRYKENGTIYEHETFYPGGSTYIRYDDNGMVIYDFTVEYPILTSYSYFENGNLSYSYEGTIASHLTYEGFMDLFRNIAAFRLFTEATEITYRESGALEEIIIWGVFTKHLKEYDENGIITNEIETGYNEYNESNEAIWRVTKIYVEGVLYDEECWESELSNHCTSE